MSKKSDAYKKWGVILMGLLFLGSMAGVALDSSGSGSGSVDLPEQFVLSEDLTDEQRSVFYAAGGTVVVFEYSPLCGFECSHVQGQLEGLVSKYNGYVYLILLQGEGDMSIKVGNYQDVVDVDTVDEVEDKICGVVARHPMCIERGAVAAVLNYNSTRVDESVGEREDVNETVGNESEEMVE
ncbi:MAG: hypothetical protein DRN71_03105 [Candidatus Nanohalarchaeota archaeon]|nr:MAG: hypothetical protein DRN71_03105 [Candidatus Nanohaloarchaeota archaeon]